MRKIIPIIVLCLVGCTSRLPHTIKPSKYPGTPEERKEFLEGKLKIVAHNTRYLVLRDRGEAGQYYVLYTVKDNEVTRHQLSSNKVRVFINQPEDELHTIYYSYWYYHQAFGKDDKGTYEYQARERMEGYRYELRLKGANYGERVGPESN